MRKGTPKPTLRAVRKDPNVCSTFLIISFSIDVSVKDSLAAKVLTLGVQNSLGLKTVSSRHAAVESAPSGAKSFAALSNRSSRDRADSLPIPDATAAIVHHD
jgi:hypothetical protein